MWLHKYHQNAFLRKYKCKTQDPPTPRGPPVPMNSCLPTQRSRNYKSKQPLPLVKSHNLFTSTIFINLSILTFPETECWIPVTIVSTYSSCLHRLHGLNTPLSSLGPIHSHGSLYCVASTSCLSRLLILLTRSLSYLFCFLWPNVSVSSVPLLLTMAKSIMSIYRQHLLRNNVLECGLKCTLQGQAQDLPCSVN